MVYGKNLYANQYQDTSKRCRGSFYLFGRWKKSVFKLIWHDFLIFAAAYFFLSILYRYILFESPDLRQNFEILCVFSGRFLNQVPLTFLTGFYVSQVVSRWWNQFTALPWPDNIALKLVSFCPGKARFHKNLRLTIMRYLNLSTILVYRLVSLKVKKRFPDHQSLIESKLLLPHEALRLQKVDAKTPHESSWTPVLWAYKLLQKARMEGKIQIEPPVFANLISSLEYIEKSNRKILNYGLINFPLAYTQVTTFAVYFYFLASLFGRQYLIPSDESQQNTMAFPQSNIIFATLPPWNKHTPDFVFPLFTFVEFFCYVGWIKVAETLLNPLGDDDEDFCINYIIDRNLQVSYLIVDEADSDFEMATDPFLEAGIDIPPLPPYQSSPAQSLLRHRTSNGATPTVESSSSSLIKGDEHNDTITNIIPEEDSTMYISINDSNTHEEGIPLPPIKSC